MKNKKPDAKQIWEAIGRRARAPPAPFPGRTRCLFLPDAPQPLGGEAAPAVFHSRARPPSLPVGRARARCGSPACSARRYASARTQQSGTRGRSAPSPGDSRNPGPMEPGRISLPALFHLEEADFLQNRTLRQAIHARERGLCFYCLRRLSPTLMCLDHVVPRVESGLNS